MQDTGGVAPVTYLIRPPINRISQGELQIWDEPVAYCMLLDTEPKFYNTR